VIGRYHMRRKSTLSDLLQFSWVESDPKWRRDLDNYYEEILEETNLSEDRLEKILDVLANYRILS
jgi:hypothetical protein